MFSDVLKDGLCLSLCVIILCGCYKNSDGITRQIDHYVSVGACRPCASKQAQGGADNRGTVFSKQRAAVRPAGRDILPATLLHSSVTHRYSKSTTIMSLCVGKEKKNLCI